MALFEIQQDYTESGTNYYEVEAITLEEAIEKVQGRVLVRPPFKKRVWDYEDSFDDSFEYTTADEWVRGEVMGTNEITTTSKPMEM